MNIETFIIIGIMAGIGMILNCLIDKSKKEIIKRIDKLTEQQSQNSDKPE